MKRPTELIEKAKGFKSTDPIRVLAEYILSCEPQPPRKTVSDAVDYYDGFWPHEIRNVLSWCSKERLWFFGMPINGQYKVCTREEFEAEVERRKIPEITDVDSLTHVAPNGESCRVLCEDDRSQLIEYQDGTRACYFIKSHYATKRKPAISKAEVDAVKAYYAWMKGRFVVDLDEYLEQFKVK